MPHEYVDGLTGHAMTLGFQVAAQPMNAEGPASVAKAVTDDPAQRGNLRDAPAMAGRLTSRGVSRTLPVAARAAFSRS